MTLNRELVWSFLHFPFLLVMKLFILGYTQFVIWWKVFETSESVWTQLDLSLTKAFETTEVTTQGLVDHLNSTINNVFEVYTPQYYDTYLTVERTFFDLTESFPDSFWYDETVTEADPRFVRLQEILMELVVSVENSLFATFKINGFDSIKDAEDGTDLEFKVSEKNYTKFHHVVCFHTLAS